MFSCCKAAHSTSSPAKLFIVISVMTEAVGCWTLGTCTMNHDCEILIRVIHVHGSDSAAAGSPKFLPKVVLSDNKIVANSFSRYACKLFFSELKAYISPIGVQLFFSRNSLHAQTKLVRRPEILDHHSYIHWRNGTYKSRCIPWAAIFSDFKLLSSNLSC